MAELKPSIKVPAKKKGGWFQKIPRDILLSPGGIILIAFALFMEILDWIPALLLDQTWELPLELIFIALLITIVRDIDWKSLVVPFVLERIPLLSDIIPSWLIKLFL